jgi:hypothetical protein
MKAETMYALNLDQSKNLIKSVGAKRTVLVQGPMGNGKSSMLWDIADEMPEHTPVYFDCTTKDLGDITIPNISKLDDGTGFVTYLTNEELGAHHDKPIILMVDEFGKANPAVKNALLRLMLERKIGSHTLHPDSIIFATTNLAAEGVGDLLPPHARNRIVVVKLRNVTSHEFIEYGINHNLHPAVLSFSKDYPQIFQSFEEVQDPDENPYINHPQAQRAAFTTPRSMHAASDLLWMREHMDDVTLTAALIGTIGDRGALDLMAYVRMLDQLPTLESIKTDPRNAKVPTSPAAVCMVVYRTMGALDNTWVDAWMDYLPRLDAEAQGMFANGVKDGKYSKRALVMQNRKFTDWARHNNYMFAADKV